MELVAVSPAVWIISAIAIAMVLVIALWELR
jgi:hypothetical protein